MNRNANAAHAADDAHEAHGYPARLLAPGTCVAGKYMICDVLGTGGSAVVYAAEQLGLKRVVALKHHPASGALATQLLERFEREAQLLARVHHENVVAVFHAGSMPDGSPYLVVQRLSGESLATHLLTGPLPIAEAVDLARQVLNALSVLSDIGIVHRDVKPENLMLERLPEGRTVLKLVDFGIAKEAHDEHSRALDQMVGTPRYMAPEQVRGDKLDARCDLYALGATLYQMLTGHTPHTGDTLHEIAIATLFGPITPVRTLRRDCPEGLAQIVMKALARDPCQRFASAREMTRALDRWQAEYAQQQSVAAAHERDAHADDTVRIRTLRAMPWPTRRKIRRRRALVVACLVAVAGLLLSPELRSSSHEKPAPEPLAAHILQTRQPSTLDLMLHASSAAGALLGRASASLAELSSQAHSSTHALIRRAMPGWSSEIHRSASQK